jgi:hypothetical protein
MSFLGKSTPARNSVQQLDLFPSSTPTIVGSIIPADQPCPRCGAVEVIVGSTKGPHLAAMRCAGCRRHLEWLPSWRYRSLAGEATIIEGSVLASSFPFASGLSSAVP